MEESKSLNWLRASIRYLLEIIAACSFLLLTVGLVSASWNFLDKDAIFGGAPLLQSLWGLDQALAIDANLPLTFVVLFQAIKRRDWVMVCIYSVIGAMLLFVAAVILGTESLRQALNVTLEQAAQEIHVPIELLTLMRSAATIGLVAMSGLNLTMLHVTKTKEEKPVTAVQTTQELVDPPAPTPEPETKPKTEDKYPDYLALVANTNKKQATIPWLAEQLGVSTSTISNYRRKFRKEQQNDELEVPGTEPAQEKIFA